MRLIFGVLLVLCCFFSCSEKNENRVDVSNIQVDFLVKRYDIDFYNATAESLDIVKEKYPYFFPKTFSDSLALIKINDKDERELFAETQKKYNDVSQITTQLSSLFKHVKYYFPKFQEPNVVTMLTNIDYENRIIYRDSLLLVSLDVYLGKEHHFYSHFPDYIKENNTQDNIIVDIANAIVSQQFPLNSNRRFIDKMIFEGKKMYVLDKYLPNVVDYLKIGYTKEKLNWAIESEDDIWKYFIQRKLLFSTDTKLNQRFLDKAPFSKFYLEADRMSPGRIGVWVGWQIVKSFMDNNDVSLQELMKIEPEKLFKQSKYKPKK